MFIATFRQKKKKKHVMVISYMEVQNKEAFLIDGKPQETQMHFSR